LPDLLALIEQGLLTPEEIVTHHMPLEEAARGYQIFEKREEVPQSDPRAGDAARKGNALRRRLTQRNPGGQSRRDIKQHALARRR
jgi:hypothetical protein